MHEEHEISIIKSDPRITVTSPPRFSMRTPELLAFNVCNNNIQVGLGSVTKNIRFLHWLLMIFRSE